jgi:ankyrin repeat protein
MKKIKWLSIVLLVILLLAGGINLFFDSNYYGYDDIEKIFLAIARHDNVTVKRLVEEKHLNVNAYIGYTRDSLPLSTAIYYGNMEMVQYFLEKGADINAIEKSSEKPPLWTAIWKNRPEMALYLLEHGADPAIRQVGTRISTCQYAKNVSRSKNGAGIERVVDRLPGCREAAEEPSCYNKCSSTPR